MDLATLGLAVESRELVEATGDLNQFAASAGKAEKAAERVGTASKRTGSSLTGVSTASQRMHNEMVKVDRVVSQVEAGMSSYSGGVGKAGAATEEFGRSMQQSATQADRLERSINNISGVHARFGTVAKNTSFQTANLAAQFQDIAVSAQMGMSPLQVALQQGTQISAAFGGMGAAGAVRALGTAFLSVINPVSLLTIGLVAAGTAAIQYFTSTEDDAKDTDVALKQHDAAIRALQEAYGEAAKGAQSYLVETREMARALTIISQHNLAEKLQGDMAAIVDSGDLVVRNTEAIAHEMDVLKAKLAETFLEGPYLELEKQLADLEKQLQDTSTGALAASNRFAPFRQEIERAIDTYRQGGHAMVALRQAISERIATEPNNAALAKMADEIFRLTDAAYRTESAMAAGAASINTLGSAASANTGAVIGLSQALANLGAMIPHVAAAQRAMSGVREANTNYQAALSALNTEMKNGVITSEDVYLRKLQQVESMHKMAINTVTGYDDVINKVGRSERENAISSMSARDAAAARISETYSEQESAIRSLLDAGKSQAEVDELLTRNSAALQNALAISGSRFDQVAAKAGSRGAAKGLKEAAKAAKEAQREFDQITGVADGLVEKWFPAEAARIEAQKLMTLMDEFGGKLTDLQRNAMQLEIDELFNGAGKAAKEAGDTVTDTLGSALSELFVTPSEDMDEFFSSLTSRFAQLGQQNIELAFSSLFGGGKQTGNINSPDFVPNTTLSEVLGVAVQKGATVGAFNGSSTGILGGFGAIFGGGGASGGAGAGGGGLLGAGLGGFGMGVESQNPIIGAIGGAISGWAAGASIGAVGGPLGAVIGDIKFINKPERKAA